MLKLRYIEIQLETLIMNFVQSMVSIILSENDELIRRELYDDLDTVLANLLSPKDSSVVGTIRHRFNTSLRPYFFNSADNQLIEQWELDDLDYCIFIKREEELFTILAKREITPI